MFASRPGNLTAMPPCCLTSAGGAGRENGYI